MIPQEGGRPSYAYDLSSQKKVLTAQHLTLVVVLLMINTVSVYSEVKNQLKCTGGDNVTFACPCPEGFNSCRFKKFFQRGFILRDGVVSDDHQGRYAADGQSATITLKGCKKDDEGGYVSMCGGSDTNKEFHLSVVKVTNDSLKCRTGDEVTFGCPCCPEKLDSFTFEKIGGDFIVRNGALNNHHNKYELSENKTQVTLKMCNEDDKGKYVWKCDSHEHSMDLTIMKSNNHYERTSTPVEVILFSFILATFAQK